jgi:hypothetical protein
MVTEVPARPSSQATTRSGANLRSIIESFAGVRALVLG